MSPHPHGRRRGFLLIEVIVLVGLLSLVAGAALWATRMHLDVQRRTAEQATREICRRMILRELRDDLATSTSIRLALLGPREERSRAAQPVIRSNDAAVQPKHATASAATSEPDEARLARLEIERPDGLVTYMLTSTPPPVPDDRARRRAQPSGQELVREASGVVVRRSLHGQFLSLATRRASAGMLLDVCFETRQRFETGDETVHRFDTTLLAAAAGQIRPGVGGGP